MRSAYIDTHIHLDTYPETEQHRILEELEACGVKSLISVSMHLESSRRNRALSLLDSRVKPAFGFHPEQPLPGEEEVEALFAFMEAHLDIMAAVGEVGLPYYSRLEAQSQGQSWDNLPYQKLLERFISFAAKHGKPIILHAVYEDADIACDLLEQYDVRAAHFHWFKGSPETVKRMADCGYYISFTPDLLYEEEMMDLAAKYPMLQVMTETDGPWPFEGPFQGRTTHPGMTSDVAHAWARIRGLDPDKAHSILYDNARRFYRLD
ncbi:TatD family hydrolase [Paenibacillus lemnae]|uniref:TatD family hydrolase n=1 Tax=Paenibacillus lemnae TaxID=1330551 RepID=A0A848M6K3_PAELE|nr:TatD family hydrolase [Paenibacillus lemnae]NMO96355.1 TatD family hydrolase [Paenibacillus lemnae]